MNTPHFSCLECKERFTHAGDNETCPYCDSDDIVTQAPVVSHIDYYHDADLRAGAAMDTLIEVAKGNYDVPSYNEGFLKVRQAS